MRYRLNGSLHVFIINLRCMSLSGLIYAKNLLILKLSTTFNDYLSL